MAGPAIRAVELGRVLAGAGHPVAVAAPVGSALDDPLLQLRPWTSGPDLRAAVDDADVVVAFAPVVADHMWLAELGCPLVVDAYDPGLLETLEGRRGQPVNAQRDWVAAAGRHLVDPLRVADVVLVASERQRHARPRDPRRLRADRVPSGGRGPHARRPGAGRALRAADRPAGGARRRPSAPLGAVHGRPFVALWGGGLYPWLDPVDPGRGRGRHQRRRISAAFLAGPHPTPAVGRMPLVDEARRRTEELGLGRPHRLRRPVGPLCRAGSVAVLGATWGCPCTGPTPRPSSRSAHASSTTSGPGCRWCARAATSSPRRSRPRTWEWSSPPVTSTGWPPPSIVWPPLMSRSAAPAGDRLAGVAARRTWSQAAAPLLDVVAQPRLAADRRATEPQARGTVAALRRAVRVARSAGG